jgi:rsbT co-antagonist protein RsbR
MLTPSPELPLVATGQSDLVSVLRTTLIGALVIGPMDIASGLALSQTGLILTGALTLVYGCAVMVALGHARSGRTIDAARINVFAMLALAITTVLCTPVAMPACLMVALAMPIFAVAHVSRRDLHLISAASIVAVLSILLLARFVQLFPPIPEPVASLILIVSAVVIAGIIVLLFLQVHGRLSESVAALRASNGAIAAVRDELEQRVAEQTADIQQTMRELQRQAEEQGRLLMENAEQRALIAELSLPILPVSDDVLVMPLVGSLEGSRLREAQSHALASIERLGARHLILDITGVPVIDTQIATGLLGIVAAARLLGAATILVGVRPEVAQTIVGLGLDLSQATTRATLQGGLQYALRLQGRPAGGEARARP